MYVYLAGLSTIADLPATDANVDKNVRLDSLQVGSLLEEIRRRLRVHSDDFV